MGPLLRITARHVRRYSRPAIPESTPDLAGGLDFAGDQQRQAHDDGGERDCAGPEEPLRGVRVADVSGVHAEVGGDEREREEDYGDDGEDEDGGFLAIFVGFDAADVLCRGGR